VRLSCRDPDCWGPMKGRSLGLAYCLLAKLDMRFLVALCSLLSFAALAMVAGGCTNNCVASPGVCPPNPLCVDGYRRTGSASCENGTWICGRVACVPDADVSDGPGPDADARY
jgi:hypothetical protein